MNRIDSNQLSQLQSQSKKSDQAQKNTVANTAAPSKVEAAADMPTSSSVEISAAGRQLQALEQSMDTQAFDEQKVSLIKQAVDDGTYKPNSVHIAHKMIEMDS